MGQQVLCDAYGTLKPQQTEIAVLLSTNSPSVLPGEDVVSSCLETIPSPEGLARLALNRWSRSTGLAGHQEILDAFIKLHVSESSAELKPAAKAFLSDVRSRLVQLVQDSLARFGDVEGPVYDEVYGENADKTKIPAYLPVVSHFQLHFHDIANDKSLHAAWDSALAACSAELADADVGLGNSPKRRALVYLLSMGEDIAFLRLAEVLLKGSCEFVYE
ncbi:hypothetical protein VOLCADRAFT_121006 [Volvox carteri f. nagariensis]|uniref:Uncharacterized protein n=1 Tax=Volvox carteri f. nagariensis TaxID=3068 RepID=D8TZC4_VOLCA|nr:uncharacterized protein VOLCADRAFT_121006 [Volvox carteri f. nagariensis]EFJ47249.1 hypothetical protein VOLCADRAFT_121006 [Volvox carteri f. nagariensis]|eukprot:XP_002951798.1 hypothetical protein VOLCADRAFT_121006 [Volvox carteri f. nagariensis]